MSEGPGQASAEARATWQFLWARVKNLYPLRGANSPLVRMDQAPDDLAAVAAIQELLDERERLAYERAAKACEDTIHCRCAEAIRALADGVEATRE
jgi:hypothetical protein